MSDCAYITDHESFRPAVFPVTKPRTDYGREQSAKALELAKSLKAPKPITAAAKKPKLWRDVPEAFKRLVARSAGLDAAVCDKDDGQLSVNEKKAIRAAAARLLELADTVFSV